MGRKRERVLTALWGFPQMAEIAYESYTVRTAIPTL